MSTIFALSLCSAPKYWHLLEGSFYMCLVPQFLLPVPWIYDCCWGDTLVYLALLGSGLHSGSPGTLSTRETVLARLPPPGHCQSWSFGLRGRLQGWHTSRGSGGDLRAHRPWGIIFVIPHSFATAHQYLPERGLYTCSEPWFLQLLTRGHLQIAWFWRPVGLMRVVPQACIY